MPIKPTIPPTRDTDLRHYPWIVLRFRCNYCKRWADGGLAACAEKFGAATTLGELLAMFMSKCAWSPVSHVRTGQKFGGKCGAYCPDIGRTSPPDLPTPAGGLTVIDGGKDGLLSAEGSRKEWRRPRTGNLPRRGRAACASVLRIGQRSGADTAD